MRKCLNCSYTTVHQPSCACFVFGVCHMSNLSLEEIGYPDRYFPTPPFSANMWHGCFLNHLIFYTMTCLSTIHGLSGVAYNWYRRSRNSLVSYAVDGVAQHISLNPAIPLISVRTPSGRLRVCIFISIFYVESTCHFTDVSFSANIQYGTCACVAGFHVWLLVRIRLYRFPRTDTHHKFPHLLSGRMTWIPMRNSCIVGCIVICSHNLDRHESDLRVLRVWCNTIENRRQYFGFLWPTVMFRYLSGVADPLQS